MIKCICAFVFLFLISMHPADSCAAAAFQTEEVSSSIAVRPVTDAHPVFGADEMIHIPYELEIVNQSGILVTVERVEVLDGDGRKLDDVTGERLATRIRISGGESGKTFGPSHSGYLFMDISLPKGSRIPSLMKHRVSITRELRARAGDDHTGTPLPAGIDAGISFEGIELPVDQTSAVTISPPLRGPSWVAFNGCCDELNSHRGTILAINGTLRVFERFAIDFVQLDSNNLLFSGDASALSSYGYFGTPVYSVAEGTVSKVVDGAAEQTPGKVAPGLTLATAGGNNVVVDIGGGRFALYAHLQRNSIAVKVGDRVRVGEVLGRIGNSGNTDAPHLHFQVMDAQSNSLPFVIANFAGQGVVTGGAVFRGEAGIIENKFTGSHTNAFPLNKHVVRFE